MINSPLNVVIVGPAHPYRGGIALGNERLAEEFINDGHQVKIHTFTVQYPSFLFPGKTQYSEAKAPKHLNITRSINSINPFNWLIIGRKIKKEKPDIVIFRYWLPMLGPCFGTIARIIRRNKKSKIITILDNVIPHENRMGDKLFTRYFIKPIHAFISMSQKVENDLANFDKKKPRTYSPHPLFDNFGQKFEKNHAKSVINIDQSKNYILFFGLVRDYKGLDLLLEGFKLFDYKKFNVKLLIAGEYYSNEEKYINMMKDLEIIDDVISVNKFIKDDEVGYYFSASDIIAQPYKSATQSGVTQIAYHFESPLLVTNVGGLPEMVPDQKVGYVVEKNPAQIAAALTDFFENNRSDYFKINIKSEKEKYTWDKMLQKIKEIYREI